MNNKRKKLGKSSSKTKTKSLKELAIRMDNIKVKAPKKKRKIS